MEKAETISHKDLKEASRFRLRSIIPVCIRMKLLICFLSFVAISIYSGTKLFFTVRDSASVQVAYEDIVNNWSSDMIRQIIEISPKEQCPGNFTDLMRFDWSGTPESCSCLESSIQDYPSLSKTIHHQLCNSTMMEAGCTPVEGSPARPLFTYNGRRFCAQRMSETSFFLSIQNMNDDGTCKEGFINCGGRASSHESICVNASMFDNGCPIKDIANEKLDASYIRIGNSEFYYSKADYLGTLPYSEMKLSNTSTCFDSPQAINDPLKSQSSKSAGDPCVYGGHGFVAFDDGVAATTFLSKQGVSYASDPSKAVDQTIKPFKRSYFSFKPSCRRELLQFTDHASLSLSPKRLFLVGILAKILILSSVIGSAILLLTLLIKPLSRVSRFTRYAASFLVVVANLVAVEISFYMTYSTHSYFENMIQDDCADSTVLEIFESLALITNLDLVFKRHLLLGLGSIFLVSSFLWLVGSVVYRRLQSVRPSTDPVIGIAELSSIKAESQASKLAV